MGEMADMAFEQGLWEAEIAGSPADDGPGWNHGTYRRRYRTSRQRPLPKFHITCNHCQEGPFRWKESHDRWRLFDREGNEHICPALNPTQTMKKKAQYPTKLKLDHKDQNGRVQFISEMETDHIVNLIRMMIRKAQGPQDEFQAQMHGVTITGGAEAAKKAYEFIAPYVMELCVRGLAAQITSDLQGLVRRSDKIVLFPDEPKLIEGDVVDIDFDDDHDPLDYPEL